MPAHITTRSHRLTPLDSLRRAGRRIGRHGRHFSRRGGLYEAVQSARRSHPSRVQFTAVLHALGNLSGRVLRVDFALALDHDGAPHKAGLVAHYPPFHFRCSSFIGRLLPAPCLLLVASDHLAHFAPSLGSCEFS